MPPEGIVQCRLSPTRPGTGRATATRSNSTIKETPDWRALKALLAEPARDAMTGFLEGALSETRRPAAESGLVHQAGRLAGASARNVVRKALRKRGFRARLTPPKVWSGTQPTRCEPPRRDNCGGTAQHGTTQA